MRELNLPLPEKPEGIAQAQLEIHLLGNPEVLWRGQPISIKRRNTRLLLFFLADQDMPVNRKYLANLFRENLPEAAARQNLRQALYRLRTSFPYPHILIERDDIVALDSNQVCVDVIQFSSDYSSVFAQVHQILNSKILTEEIVQKLRLMNGQAMARSSLSR